MVSFTEKTDFNRLKNFNRLKYFSPVNRLTALNPAKYSFDVEDVFSVQLKMMDSDN